MKFIGVDPSLTESKFQVCIINTDLKTATFKRVKNLTVYMQILIEEEPDAIIVENSNLQKAVFNPNAGIGGAIAVGKNMGLSQAVADISDLYSKIPSGISPKEKGAKIANEMIFQGITKGLDLIGYKPQYEYSQDQRDAFMLAQLAEKKFKTFLREP